MIRRQGYACNSEENTIGIIGIAVPVFDARNRVVAGLSLHAPAARMSLQMAVSKLDRLRETARQIEQIMRELVDAPGMGRDAAE